MWTLRRASRLRLASRLPLAASAPHHLFAAHVCSKAGGPGPELITRLGTEDPRMSVAVVHKPSRTVNAVVPNPEIMLLPYANLSRLLWFNVVADLPLWRHCSVR